MRNKYYFYLKDNDIIQKGDEFRFKNLWNTFSKDSMFLGWKLRWVFSSLMVRRLIKYKRKKFDSNKKPNWQ